MNHNIRLDLWAWLLVPGMVAACLISHVPPAHAFGTTECAASRFGSNLGCTANDVSVTNIQVVGGSVTSCTGGDTLTFDFDLTINSGTPNRWDIGIFIGNDGKTPQLLPASGGAATCSVGILPTTDPPFRNLDPGPWSGITDTCGDVNGTMNGGSGQGVLRMTGVPVLCQANSGSNGNLVIPYVVSWDNQSSPTGSLCRSNADPVPNTTSKCNVSNSPVGVVVMPAITITDGVTTITSGSTTTYTVVVSNSSGVTLSNPRFKVPAVSGIAVSGVTCSAAGGGICPGAVTVALMQGAGLEIPDMLNGSSVTFTITATLTGNPGDTLTNTATVTVRGETNSAADTDTIVAPPVDHYELSVPTPSITCLPTTATVTACADSSSPCTNNATTVSGQTANLSTTGGTLASTTVTFNASGVASTTLSYPAAANNTAVSVTLSGEQITATNPRKCCQGGVCVTANSCSTTFNTAGFIFANAVNGGVATIPTQVAGTSSGTFYLRAVRTNTTTKACESALSGLNTVNFAYECNDPTTCYGADLMSVNGGSATTIARNNNGSVTSYTPVSMTFDGNGNAPFTFNYSDVGLVKLYASKSAGGSLLSALTGSSNSFVVRPFGFLLSNIRQTAAPNTVNPAAPDATSATFVRAGENFSVTATAVQSDGVTATPNYGREIAAESVRFVDTSLPPADPNYANHGTLAPGLGLSNNPAINGSFGAFTNGVATGTTFNWLEAGIIRLTPSVGDGNYLGIGDVVGIVSPNIGRFYPDHFALSGLSLTNRTDIGTCSASFFTYMDEPFQAGFTLTAQGPSPGNVTLLNYVTSATPANNFAKLATGTPIPAGFYFAFLDGTTNLTTRVDSSLGIAPSTGWAAGVLNATATLSFTRPVSPTPPDGPYNTMRVGIAPVDSDGVALSVFNMDVNNDATNDHAQVGQTQIRFGRLRLQNAYGSELLPLPVPMTVQYWDGTAFITNTLDSCTPLLQANIGMVNNLSGGGTTTATVGAAFASGVGSLTLSAPGAGKTGSVDLAINLGTTANAAACPALTPLADPANLGYLRGLWCGAAYDKDPAARATFGVYASPSQFIYLREMY